MTKPESPSDARPTHCSDTTGPHTLITHYPPALWLSLGLQAAYNGHPWYVLIESRCVCRVILAASDLRVKVPPGSAPERRVAGTR